MGSGPRPFRGGQTGTLTEKVGVPTHNEQGENQPSHRGSCSTGAAAGRCTALATGRNCRGAAWKRCEAVGAPGARQRGPTGESLLRSRSSLRSVGHGPGPRRGHVEAGSRGGVPGEGHGGRGRVTAVRGRSGSSALRSGFWVWTGERPLLSVTTPAAIRTATRQEMWSSGTGMLAGHFVLRRMPGDVVFQCLTAGRPCCSARHAGR